MERLYALFGLFFVVVPSAVYGEHDGEIIAGMRATHYASDKKSAKYEEYLDQSDGLISSGWLFYQTDAYRFDASFDTSSSFDISGNLFGLFKGRINYDNYTHNISNNALSPAGGIGSDYLVVPDALVSANVPPISSWQEFDYKVDRTNFGGEVTVGTDSPFYSRVSYEQQRSDGILPYGTVKFTGFELPMPVDYSTNILSADSGYRDRETALSFGMNYSDFNNGNDILTIFNGTDVQEYSTAPDNYSYTINGALIQQMPLDSLLALDVSYTRNVSEADFDSFATLYRPTPDTDFDGDVTFWQARLAVSRRFGPDLSTKLYYEYIDRNDDSDEAELGNSGENNLFNYDKHKAGLDFDYRLNTYNKLHSGYEFTRMNRDRTYVGYSTDNLLYGQWNNTSLDWLEVKLRLEYLKRDADTDFGAATLETNNDLIYQYFKPYDVASKELYSAKLAFEFYPAERFELGLSYALIYDDYDNDPGLQDELRHEIYVDANYEWESTSRLSVYVGYEYTDSDLDNRWTILASSPPNLVGTYLWGQASTYNFFVIGTSFTVPVIDRVEMVMNVDYQFGDGEISYSPSKVAGENIENLNNADDYYKTQLGVKAIYAVSDSVTLTAGYQFEKANLEEWYYDNYSYTGDFYYLSGAGLDHDYEAHQFYLVWTYRF